MSARRQASTTSLSKFARANSPDVTTRSGDFCNAFWGLGDGGVDVLFARMRGATRTIDELKAFFKERTIIEEDYSKRLAKLAKLTLGRDEIGELRNSLDTLRLETEKQAGFHIQLAQQIRNDIDNQTITFSARQTHFKKSFQAAIEKEFKAKQTQESYVNRAREKYESDCLRINSYTAQSTLVQGKDLEKIHLKLERAQQTVQANERDFANFARAFQDTVAKWEQDWKAFCDGAQDLEEERMEFMKDTMWAYANAVSTVCVSDDESCERMRLALEQMEPDKDMENFVRDYGTGNAIPDPPAFVNYTSPDAVSSSSSRPTTRPAQFARSSQRPTPARMPPPPQPQEDDVPAVNTAGVGAGGGSRRGTVDEGASLSRAPTRGSTRGGVNGTSSSGAGAGASVTRQPTSGGQAQLPPGSFRPLQDPNADPIDPTAKTLLKIGEKAYEVDLTKDPQQQGGSSSRPGTSAQLKRNGTLATSGGVDPLAQTMEDLNAGSSSGSGRRNSVYRQGGSSRKGTMESAAGSGPSSLSPPASSSNVPQTSATPAQKLDYRRSAEQVVGSHPISSRPSSPNPPTANFFPKSVSPPNSGIPVEGVVADYEQSFPGERKPSSRRNSFNAPLSRSPTNQNASQSQGQNLGRPVSREGHAGIGANGRSTSPQPISRGPSPAGLMGRNSINTPNGGIGRSGSIAHRATSPNSVGIALDQSGRVAMDQMADMYNSRQPSPYGQPQQQHQPSRHNGSFTAGSNGMAQQPPSQQYSPYGVSPAPQNVYSQPPSQPPYTPHPPPGQVYNQPSHYQPPPAQPVYQPQPHTYQGPNGNNVQRGPSVGAGGYNSYDTSSSWNNPQNQPQARRITRSPSPQPPPQQGPPPTGAYTEDGRGILFYVKALYDYTATIEEEFDFQSGDIIAVTATPEDGWWSGELLDEARRQHGRHVFPSNFVCLF